MTTPAQVTEAHLELAKTVIFSRDSAGRLLTAPMGAQLIADSEAKAVEAERARLYGIGRKKGEQPVSSDMDIGHRCLSGDKWPQPVDPIAECARLGRELADSIAERDQLRAERNNLRADLDAIKAIRDEETARAERAEAELSAEQDMRSCVEAELARELARLRKLAIVACKEAQIKPVVWYPKGSSIDANNLGKINEQQVDACVAAIDAAIKEGAP